MAAGAGCSLLGKALYFENNSPARARGTPRREPPAGRWGPSEGPRGPTPPRAAGRWVGAEGRGWVLNATSFGLWAGGGPLREAPRVKMQKGERARRGLSLPLSRSGEVLGGREEGGPAGAHREHGSGGRASTGLARLAVARGPEGRGWQGGVASPPRLEAGMRGIRAPRGLAGHPRPSRSAAFPGCPPTPPQPTLGGGRRGRLSRPGEPAAPGQRHRPSRPARRKRPPQGERS